MAGVIGSVGRIVLGAVIGAALARGDARWSRPPQPSATPPIALAATISDAEQAEDIFAYGVIADVGRRSADGVRFLDALIFAVLAAQVAAYVLYIEKSDRFQTLVPVVHWALWFSVLAFVPTVLVKELPEPRTFLRAFQVAPRQTREVLMEQFIAAVGWNGVLRAVKLAFFALAFALTLWAIFHTGTAYVAGGSAPQRP